MLLCFMYRIRKLVLSNSLALHALALIRHTELNHRGGAMVREQNQLKSENFCVTKYTSRWYDIMDYVLPPINTYPGSMGAC